MPFSYNNTLGTFYKPTEKCKKLLDLKRRLEIFFNEYRMLFSCVTSMDFLKQQIAELRQR